MKIKRKTVFIFLFIVGAFILTILLLNFLNKEEKEVLTDKNSVQVYFIRIYDENNYKLTSVRRKIYENESRIEVALAELLRGPVRKELNSGYFTEIPEETELLSIKNDSERIIVNLSKDFEEGGGSSSMTLRVEQLINTVLDSVDKKAVYLELDGKQVQHIGGEGVVIPQPLSRNLTAGQEL